MTDYVYAVFQNNKINNIIVSDQKNAEEILKKIIIDAEEIIMSDENTGNPYIDGDFFEGQFRVPKPYSSWIWNNETKEWEAPLPYPQDNITYTWDESSVSWSPHIPNQPYPSWTWDEVAWSWEPPISYPEDEKQYMWDEESMSWIEVPVIQ